MEPETDPQLPSVDQVTAQLLAGLPSAPTSGTDPEAPREGTGFRLVEPPREEQPPSAPPRPASFDDVETLRRQLGEMGTRLQQEEVRRAENQRNFHQADQGRQMAVAVADGLTQARQREQALWQQAMAARPPEVANPDELLADGKTLLEFLGRYGAFIEGRVLSQFAPYVQQFAEMQGFTQVQVKNAQRFARNEARDLLSEVGIPKKEFDESWPELEAMFSSYGPQGQQMMLDPEQLKHAHILLQVQKGKNPFQGPRKSPPAPGSDPRPSAAALPDRATSQSLAPMARHIAKTLGLGNDLPIAPGDLARVGLVPGG